MTLIVVMHLDQNPPKPEFIRLPKPGQRCPYTGLARTTMSELTVPGPVNDYRPPVRSTLLRRRGATRGIRLIDYDSLIQFLSAQTE